MLIKFKIENYLSFKEETEFSTICASLKTDHENDATMFLYPETDIKKWKDIKINKFSALFGANASGKTNFIKATKFFCDFVHNSSKEYTSNDFLPFEPFLFDDHSKKSDSQFEIVFRYKDANHRYGFTFNKKKVTNEWLFIKKTTKESEVFIREENKEISFGSYYQRLKKYTNDEGKTRENALFLSLLIQLGASGDVKDTYNYITNNIVFDSDLSFFTDSILLERQEEKEFFLELIRAVDFGIEELSLESNEDSNELYAYHKLFAPDNSFIGTQKIKFSKESDGTKKFVKYLGVIVDVIINDKVLIIDELEENLHLFIIEEILKLFKYKKSKAQLIFTTHNLSLMDRDIFRRDQIILVEKNEYGSTYFNELSNYKVTSQDNFLMHYKRGKYGAVPYINENLLDKLEKFINGDR